jgi:NADH dehydrogenase FAD-containing subunit
VLLCRLSSLDAHLYPKIRATGHVPISTPLRTLAPECITSDGYISVRPTLQLADPAYPTVFAIGDVADTKNQKSARRAVQHAHIVAENIARLAAGDADAELSEYSQVPWRICLSLGLVSRRYEWKPRMSDNVHGFGADSAVDL